MSEPRYSYPSAFPNQPVPPATFPGAYPAPRPRFSDVPANWGWVVVGVIFFWPLGIAAANAAGRVVPAMLDGDAERAFRESRRARKFGIISLCITLGLMALYIVVIIVIIASAVHSCQAQSC